MLEVVQSPLMDELRGLQKTEFPELWGDRCLISQHVINMFASATGDRQWIHVDVERAKLSRARGTIAHGRLTDAMIMAHLTAELAPISAKYPSAAMFHDGGEYKFLSPVREGQFIRCRGFFSDVVTSRKTARLAYQYEICIVDGKLAARGRMDFACMC